MNVPMREKYVDEAVGIFIIFGVRLGGGVDVCSHGGAETRDIFINLPREKAEEVCKLQQEFREKLYATLCK